jgi:protein-tyrosine phosphatase
LYRSDGLQGLTAGDIVRYEALGIRTMFDLRRDQEREECPNRVPSVPLCIMTPVDRSGDVDAAPTYCDTRASGEERLLAVYRSMLWNSAPVLGTLIGRIVAPVGTPVGFHCHAGKDRTGFVAAILLEAVGVERDVPPHDYELTATYRRPAHQTDSFERLVAGGMPAEAALGIMGAPRWAMAETLAELDAAFGGARRYLIDRGGLDDTTLRSLQEAFVE